MHSELQRLADAMVLGALLDVLQRRHGAFELLAHWKQGEFHHDVVLAVEAADAGELPGRFLVVSTNCNGGIKEVLAFDELPERSALWHRRCPTSEDFLGELPTVLECVRTLHFFDPCELLGADARSELRPEFRRRQHGGGWERTD